MRKGKERKGGRLAATAVLCDCLFYWERERERDLVVVRLTVPTAAAADDDEQRSRGWRAGR